MANLLTMADIQAILNLHEQGWRQRRIARELDIDRETVAKYIRASRCVPKPAKAPIGSEVIGDQAAGRSGEARGRPKPSRKRTGSTPAQRPPCRAYHLANSKPAKAPLGSEGQNQPKRPSARTIFLGPPIRPKRPLTWWRAASLRRSQLPWRRKAVAVLASRIGR